jgi:hypothetical protein
LIEKERLLSRKPRIYGRRYPSRWPRGTLYPHKLAITSPKSGGRSVVIVRSRTQTMEFSLLLVGLERGPLSFVSTIEELLERKSSGSGLENREYGSRDPSR